jgi:hypothetical protein
VGPSASQAVSARPSQTPTAGRQPTRAADLWKERHKDDTKGVSLRETPLDVSKSDVGESYFARTRAVLFATETRLWSSVSVTVTL